MNEDHKLGIHFVLKGEGPPVILIHGLAASHHDWDSLGPALAESGYRAYAIDLPGHYNGAREEDPHSLQAGEVLRRLERWVAGLQLHEPPVLIGHSLGGYFSLRYSLEHPPAGLVLIDPFFSRSQLRPVIRFLAQHPDVGARFTRRRPQWLTRAMVNFGMNFTEKLPETARRQTVIDYLQSSPNIYYTPATIEDLTPRLGEIRVPTLVIWGESDLTLAPGSFPDLVKKLPDARGLALPGLGHQPHLSSPEIVNDRIIRFLSDERSPAENRAG